MQKRAGRRGRGSRGGSSRLLPAPCVSQYRQRAVRHLTRRAGVFGRYKNGHTQTHALPHGGGGVWRSSRSVNLPKQSRLLLTVPPSRRMAYPGGGERDGKIQSPSGPKRCAFRVAVSEDFKCLHAPTIDGFCQRTRLMQYISALLRSRQSGSQHQHQAVQKRCVHHTHLAGLCWFVVCTTLCVCVFLIVDFDVLVVKSHLPLCLALGKPGSQGKHIPGIARKTKPNSITLLCGRLCV